MAFIASKKKSGLVAGACPRPQQRQSNVKHSSDLHGYRWAWHQGGWKRRKFGLKVRFRAFLRAFVRGRYGNDEFSLVLLAGILGATIGLGVAAVHECMQWMHQANFGLPKNRLLSEGFGLVWWRVLVFPAIGGLAVGIALILIRRWRPREIVDAIEANALYGGKMSLTDSANLTLLTVLSGGFGASVGLEAAYTQLGAGVASKLGQFLRLRRSDLRMVVGCGAAAAIGAAFNAPLAGAFYTFELVIGSYSTAVLAPVAVAALTGTFTARLISGSAPIFLVSRPVGVGGWDYLLFAVLGFSSAGLGILVMIGVTWLERALRRRAIPLWLRPVLGGTGVGLIGFFFPQVLGSGHGAIQEVVNSNFAPTVLFLLVVAKALASALSIGSGFRGGLFSSSLFLGSLFGSAVGGLLTDWLPELSVDQLAYTLVGMGAMAAAIVGAPVTMILLILEATGSFYVAVGVTIGVIIASVVVRLTFGYSFATWRFHLRGVPIYGAVDIGWIRELTAEKLMRRDVQTAPEDLAIADFRRQFPLGGPTRVFLLDSAGRYRGMVNTADAYNPDLDEKADDVVAGDLTQGAGNFLLPRDDVRVALDHFAQAQLDVLPVVASAADRKVLGFVTEAYALRRYSQELERSRIEEVRPGALFGRS